MKSFLGKTYRGLILAVLLAGAASICNAATYTGTQIMNKVVNALNSASSLTARMNITAGNSGSYTAVLNMSHDKFRYSFGGMDVYFDGKTQWTVDKSSKEVSLTEPTADELAETNPLAFVNNFSKNYKAEYMGESNGTYTVKLTALKKSAYVRTAQVVISGASWLPTHITAKLSSGQTLTIIILSAEKGGNMSPSQFKYDTTKTPEYEIIDLR